VLSWQAFALMALTRRVFRTRLLAEDPVARDHRIHGVRVLPGMAFLDLILRMARQCGLDPARVRLRRIRFAKPIAVDEAKELPVRLVFEEQNGVWGVRLLTPGEAGECANAGEWEEHARAELVHETSNPPPKADCHPLAIDWANARDLDEAYAMARAAGIQHWDFMKSGGRFALDQGGVWAELILAASAVEYADQFWLHPALLDAATVAAAAPLANVETADAQAPCLPFLIEEFRAVSALPARCLARAEAPRPSGNSRDMYSQDIDLFDLEGHWLAGFTRLTGKRVRSSDAILRLEAQDFALESSPSETAAVFAGPTGPTGAVPDRKTPDLNAELPPPSEAGPGTVSNAVPNPREPLVAALYSLIAGYRHGQLDGVGEEVRFYDQGLESMDLLKIVELLETKLGRQLYPTLLFEHPSIGQLADYLLEQMPESVGRLLPALADADPLLASVLAAAPSKIPESPAIAPISAPASSKAGEDPPRAHPGQDGDSVAVIGMSGRFPLSPDLAALWSNLRAGRDCIREVPADRWDASAYYAPEKGQPGKSCGKWGGWLEDHDCFDHRFFRISPRDAEKMDPQERLFLETVWAVIEDAGYTPDGLGRAANGVEQRQVGVFVGSMWTEYQLFHNLTAAPEPVYCQSSLASVANRVSYCFDFHGPSLGVDTMCSSSLLAVHLACRSLLSGECRVAVAGGVNLSLHPAKYLSLSEHEALSTDGRCRSFGEGGDGYVPSEGVGAVLLKPLRQAVADHDVIYGVIRGSAANHGGATSGFTVPSPKAQAEVIARALEVARVHPRTLSYLEAHGTGTALGDPIEIQGLAQAFRRWTSDTEFCALGSIKSNLGHLEAAAGVASLIKVLLQMRFGQWVPSLHSETPNAKIPWAETPFRLQREPADWPRPIVDLGQGRQSWPRRAAISSFGAGGTNVHIVVEEPMESGAGIAAASPAGPELILLSAKGPDQLFERARQLSRYLADVGEDLPRASLPDIAYTLRVGRVEMEHRLAILAVDCFDLGDKLGKFLASKTALPGILVGRALPQRLGAPARGGVPGGLTAGATDPSAEPLEGIALAWIQGASVDWPTVFPRSSVRRASLPTYPFVRERHWVPAPVPPGAAIATAAGNGKPARADLQVEAEVAPRSLPGPVQSDGRALASVPVADNSALAERVQTAIVALTSELLKVKPSDLNPEAEVAEFGFDSVTITRLADRLSGLYGVSVNSSRFFDHPTIAGFARYLCEAFGPALRQHYGITLPEESVGAPVAPTPSAVEVQGNSAVTLRSRKPRVSDEPIAIIGMSGRFPQSHDLREFWQNLVAAKDLVTEVPLERWDWRAYYGDPWTE